AIKLAEQIGDTRTTTKAVITLGKVHWLRGDQRRALVVLTQGLDMAHKCGDRYQEVRAMVYLSLAQLEADQSPGQALERARAATELAQAIPMPVGTSHGLAAQALALAQLGRADEAADLSARAAAYQTEQTRPENPEFVLHVHATLCLAAGRRERAAQAIAQAQREVDRKAERIRNSDLRGLYLASKVPRAVRQLGTELGPA
ncbi:MAG: hypothetical protein AAGC55_34260, partial [Myxococcota bacterium]